MNEGLEGSLGLGLGLRRVSRLKVRAEKGLKADGYG